MCENARETVGPQVSSFRVKRISICRAANPHGIQITSDDAGTNPAHSGREEGLERGASGQPVELLGETRPFAADPRRVILEIQVGLHPSAKISQTSSEKPSVSPVRSRPLTADRSARDYISGNANVARRRREKVIVSEMYA